MNSLKGGNIEEIDGKKVKAMRISKRLTQRELADLSDISVSRISILERDEGICNMYYQNALSLATALSTEVHKLNPDASLNTKITCQNVVEKESHCTAASLCSEQIDLLISPHADDALRVACDGLTKSSGSDERVSIAIAGIAGYLRAIVYRVPALRKHTFPLVSAIAMVLSTAALDPDPISTNTMWPGMKNNLALLMETDTLPSFAKKEAEGIYRALVQARINDSNDYKLCAIRQLLFWLQDHWQCICQEHSAYYAWNDICCALKGAPTDHKTRAYIMAYVNEFAINVSLHDPYHKRVYNNE